MEQVRELVFFEQHFAEFIKSVSLSVKAKIDEVLFLITVAEKIPAKFFKHVEGTEELKQTYFKNKKNENEQ